MVQLIKGPVIYSSGIISDTKEAGISDALLSESKKRTITYNILKAHNTSGYDRPHTKSETCGWSFVHIKGVFMVIRQERPADYVEVYELVKKSFATSTNEGEWDYLNEVRKKDTFIPELSLVAENDDGKIIGQIVLYKTNIVASDKVYTELLLSPISVHPDFFRRGIARAMMTEAFRIAKNLGFTAVFLCGDPDFYHKFGFKASYEYGIFHIADKTKKAEWCMAYELIPYALTGKDGTVDIQ